MGKKSHAKKIIREMLKEKEEKEKKKIIGKKSRKELKKEAKEELEKNKKKKKIKSIKIKDKKGKNDKSEKKEKAKKTEKNKKEKKTKKCINKKKALGLAFSLIMVAALIAVGFLLYERALRPQPIAKILPADSTVIALELNSNFEHSQVIKAFELLEKHPQYSKEKIIEYINEKFAVDYEKDLQLWMGRQVGVTLLSPTEKDLFTVYFAEVFSQEKAKEFFEKTSPEENYKNYDIYLTDTSGYFTFIDNYLILSENRDAINYLIDSQSAEKGKLYYSQKYRRIDDNMPIGKLGFLYIDIEKISKSMLFNLDFFTNENLSSENLKPLLALFKAEGLTISALDHNFAIQSFTSLNEEKITNGSFLVSQEKYTAGLTGFTPQNTVAFWGGENLKYQLGRTLEILAGGNADLVILFQNLIQTYTTQFFGEEIDYKTDILPLLQEEFAITIDRIDGKNIYNMIVELNEPLADAVAIHELADKFAATGAMFKPQVVEHILEDGTVSQEIVAIPEEIERKESTYKDTTIYEMHLGSRYWGVYYALLKGTVVISTHMEGIQSIIDAYNNETGSLQDSNAYAQMISPVIQSSDDLSYFNVQALSEIIFDEDDPIKQYLAPIDTISSGKNYFNDGIISISYLSIK